MRENDSKRMEEIRNEGLELRRNFIFTAEGYKVRDSKALNIAILRIEPDYRFKTKKLEGMQKKIDFKSITSEEELLEAEKKDIESKKKMCFANIKEIKIGEDSLVLMLLDNTKEKDDGDVLENRKENEREFKPQEKVIIQEKSKTDSLSKEDCFKGDESI